MNIYSARATRNLSERRFDKTNTSYCRTGGSNLGCPFLRTNKRMEKICSLYRAKPRLDEDNLYSRVVLCKEHATPPTIKDYVIHAVRNIIASSSEEARELFCQAYKGGIKITTVEEGKIAEHEDIF